MRKFRILGACLVAVALATACDRGDAPLAPEEALPNPSFDVTEDPGWLDPGDATVQSELTPLAAAAPAAMHQFVNGSFETADYTGWTLFEGGATTVASFGTWGIAANGQTINLFDVVFDFFDGINVQQFSPGLPHTYVATDGDYVALQLQNGSQTHRMFQDITLPAGLKTISWDMEYTNHAGGFSPNNQVLAVNVRNPADDALLATLFATTQGVDPQSIPMTSFTGDVSAFGGQTVRISVDMIVNSFFFDAAFDNFKIDLIPVALDIKPGSCPNPFNVTAKGVLPAAILGTMDFDVGEVDPASVALEGIPALRWSMEDVATPFAGDLVDRYSCTEEGPDGMTDLTLKFDRQALLAAMGPVVDGEEVLLTLTGQTVGGVPIAGRDIIFIIDNSDMK